MYLFQSLYTLLHRFHDRWSRQTHDEEVGVVWHDMKLIETYTGQYHNGTSLDLIHRVVRESKRGAKRTLP